MEGKGVEQIRTVSCSGAEPLPWPVAHVDFLSDFTVPSLEIIRIHRNPDTDPVDHQIPDPDIYPMAGQR